jgi:hypothetical protein
MVNNSDDPQDIIPNSGDDQEPTPDDILALLEEDLLSNEEHNFDRNINLLEECLHDWENLGFSPSGIGLSCLECGQLWDLDNNNEVADALMIVWGAAKEAINETLDRLGSMESLISSKLSVQRCSACNTWSDQHIKLDHAYACSFHLGDVLAAHDQDLDDEMFEAAMQWAADLDLGDRTDLEGVVTWERLVSGSLTFASLVGEDEQSALLRPVDLHPILAEKLGLPQRLPLSELAIKLAGLLETDVPSTRQGMAFLLALLWSSMTAIDADNIEIAAANVVERSVPLFEVNRMNVAVDICGHGMSDGTTFAASMANQALTLVGQRAAIHLLNVLHGENSN